jgi:hypothetical protein
VIAKYSRQADAEGIEEHYRDSVANLDCISRVESEAIATILESMRKPAIPRETSLTIPSSNEWSAREASMKRCNTNPAYGRGVRKDFQSVLSAEKVRI